jgi:Fe-S cluster assembly ATP-binding protein
MIASNASPLLEVRGLAASVAGVPILKGIDIAVKAGEVHAIMGPNGSGKSTFSKVLAGHPSYTVSAGEVLFQGKNLLDLDPEERARAGVFLGFQYPVEVPGVTNASFLRMAYNSVQGARGKEELDPLEFDDYVREKMKLLQMDFSIAALTPAFPLVRKSATRYCRWRCWSQNSPSSTRRIPGSTSMRYALSRKA